MLRKIQVSRCVIEDMLHLPGELCNARWRRFSLEDEGLELLVRLSDNALNPDWDSIPQMRGMLTKVPGDDGKTIRIEAEWKDV